MATQAPPSGSPPQPLPTLDEYLVEWLVLQRSRIQPSTWRSYAQMVRCYLLPRLGELRLDEVDVATLDRTYSALLQGGGKRGKPLAPRTVKYAATVLRAALEHAARTGLVDHNPATHATTPRFDHRGDEPGLDGVQAWSAAEARWFLRLIEGDRFEAIWVLALCTGMRRGELLGLRWEDVDLDERTIHVRRSLSVVERRARLKSTKTSSTRALRIDDRVVRTLLARREEQDRDRERFIGGWVDTWGLVFTYADGAYINPDTVSVAWRHLVRSFDLPVIRLHDLRHTHATLMLEAGVPVKVVSERLGHSGIQMTLDTYTHVLPAMDADAVARFAALLDGEDTDETRFGSLEGWQKTVVYLPDAVKAVLERHASDHDASVCDIIRQAVADWLPGRRSEEGVMRSLTSLYAMVIFASCFVVRDSKRRSVG